ncbi:glycosyltransferase family 4 protein [Chloroflexota bacterium]
MKILFATHPIGVQMQLLAETLRRKGYMATAVCYDKPDCLLNDVNIRYNDGQSRLRKAMRETLFTAWAVQNYDIIHFFYGGRTLLPKGLDLPWLKRTGKKVFVHFRGSDIRNRDFVFHPTEHFLGYNDHSTPPPIQSPEQRKILGRWRRYTDGMFVSTPDLLEIVPEAKLVPQTVDLSQWDYQLEPLGESPEVIRIAYPASINKGTEIIQRAIEDLKSRGYPVELVIIKDIPYREVAELYKACQIGIDNLLPLGWHGAISVELMALGRPVICYINPELASQRKDLPIVSATPRDLTKKLEALIRDRELRRSLGQQGRAYVEKWHDVNHIVDQLVEIYKGSF